MTVCIAAFGAVLEKLVLVSDRLLSGPESSFEGVTKMTTIRRDPTWVVMYAGTAANFPALKRRIGEQISGAPRVTSQVVRTACESAYKAEILRMIEMGPLLPYGWTREEFLAQGRERLTDYKFSSILDEIERIDTDLCMLICGWSGDSLVNIYEVSPTGYVVEQPLKFHAVGNGRASALATLYPLGDMLECRSVEEVVYRACAAKFAAESAPGVGRETSVVVLPNKIDQAAGPVYLLEQDVERLRDIWKAEGQPPVPKAAIDILKTRLVDIAKFVSEQQ